MYEFLCRMNPQGDIWMDIDCDVTRLIVRRLFNFAWDLAIFCYVRFGAILEKARFWSGCNVETDRVCSKIAIFSVESHPTSCRNIISCLTVIAETSLILVQFWSELRLELRRFGHCVLLTILPWCAHSQLPLHHSQQHLILPTKLHPISLLSSLLVSDSLVNPLGLPPMPLISLLAA